MLRRNPDPPIDDVRAFLYRAAKSAAVNQQRTDRTLDDNHLEDRCLGE